MSTEIIEIHNKPVKGEATISLCFRYRLRYFDTQRCEWISKKGSIQQQVANVATDATSVSAISKALEPHLKRMVGGMSELSVQISPEPEKNP